MSGYCDRKVKGTDNSWAGPGPGNYDDCIDLHYKSIPGSKMGKDARKSYFLKTTVSGNPDAGNYNIPGFKKLNGSASYSFGKSKRDEPLPCGPPGPGAYNYI